MTAFHIRRLPHYSSLDQPIFVTWRLHGSLPVNRAFPAVATSGKAFVAMDRLLDAARSGPFCLRHPETAEMVDSAIRYRDAATGHYRLHAYAAMPNHVPMLITPHVGVSVLMQSLKRFTARQANRMRARIGEPFWQEESYDRLVRNRTEFERIALYIEMNPVAAGLVASPELFPWSSARPIHNRPRVTNPPHSADPAA